MIDTTMELNDTMRKQAEGIINKEIEEVNRNADIVKGNGCAACHVLFRLKESMKVSEQDAADLLSEVLSVSRTLNEDFIAMVESIHMKQRMMGVTFSIKTRDAKDRYIDSNFKNTLSELLSDASVYGTEILMRKLILSNIALNIAQNLGVDYHAATEELYYYMRKNDESTHEDLMQVVKSIIDRCKNR